MRVLICIATMEGGGAERQVTYLAKALVDAGEDVHVALIKGGVNLDRLKQAVRRSILSTFIRGASASSFPWSGCFGV
jgi:hypothetical protein